jgi:hypothetical protein
MIPQSVSNICQIQNLLIGRKARWNQLDRGSFLPRDNVKPESLKKKEPLKYLGFVSSSESM